VLSAEIQYRNPARLRAEVHSHPQSGERTSNCLPRRADGPSLKNATDTGKQPSVPPAIDTLLDSTNRDWPHPQDNLKTTIDESYTAVVD